MKPFRAFLFLLTVLTFFLLVQYLKEFRVKPTVPDSPILDESSDSLVLNLEKEDFPASALSQKTDSISAVLVIQETKLFNSWPFSYAPDDSVRFSYLFNKLHHINDEKLPVRVIYFGDSQIENDQVTSSLRQQLQIRFGGKGPGFIPLDHFYNPAHQLILEISKGWQVRNSQDKDFLNSSLLFKNTLLEANGSNGWFRLKRIQSLNPQPDYELMKLYYMANDNCTLEVRNSEDLIYSGELPFDEQVGVLDFQFNRTPDDIRLNFMNNGLLNILGISLECKKGVLVDNIALRGLSYPTFEWSDKEHINQMLRQVNPGLFVFHFGVNLVPYESEDYVFFRKHFKQQVLFLKENYPKVPILIIGVSDMARKQNGIFESYPNINQIKSIQQQIAHETGAVFWDLEAFMGGTGSMIRWVNTQPELGRKDYTHFSKEGARKIGLELSQMIITAFENDTIVEP